MSAASIRSRIATGAEAGAPRYKEVRHQLGLVEERMRQHLFMGY